MENIITKNREMVLKAVSAMRIYRAAVLNSLHYGRGDAETATSLWQLSGRAADVIEGIALFRNKSAAELAALDAKLETLRDEFSREHAWRGIWRDERAVVVSIFDNLFYELEFMVYSTAGYDNFKYVGDTRTRLDAYFQVIGTLIATNLGESNESLEEEVVRGNWGM